MLEGRSALKHEGNMNVRGISQVGKAVFCRREWWEGKGKMLYLEPGFDSE